MRAAFATLALVACTELNVSPPRDGSPAADPCGGACTLGRTCQAGRCTAAVCTPGRADCDGVESNGCEVSTATEARHCGACGRVCALPSSTAICVSGSCEVGRCDSGRGDCDRDPRNGCETALATSASHCGACGASCVVDHAVGECSSGACRLLRCDSGFADCDGSPANGCEVNLATSVANCGGCGNPCPVPAHGSSTCALGACGSRCDEGFDRSAGSCLPPGAPRLMAPLSTTVVASPRPFFRWTFGDETRGAQLELCRDRAMTVGCQQHWSPNDSLRLTTALARGTWFWRARGRTAGVFAATTSEVWSFTVGARDAATGGAGTPAHDLDGDGFDDLAIAAPHARAGLIDLGGVVSVYAGSSGGVRANLWRRLDGEVTRDGLGSGLAIAGDLDGDGYSDLVAASPYLVVDGGRRAGSVLVFPGGRGGLGPAPSVTLRGRASGFGGVVVDAGDVNGDGFGDLALTGRAREDDPTVVSVYRGGPAGLSSGVSQRIADAAAQVLSGGVDLNRDGFADLLVGDFYADPRGREDAGAVRVYFGGATGLGANAARVIEGEAPGDRLGTSVAALGDVNGDGYEDFALGASGASPGGRSGAGSVRVYLGRATGAELDRSIDGAAPGDEAGRCVARVGDVNGDGFDDLAVGAPGARGGLGAVSVYLGGAAGLGQTPALTLQGPAPGSRFGTVIAGIGDVNGDGFADIAVSAAGAPAGTEEGAGRVSVHLGSAAGPSATPARVLEGSVRNGLFGLRIAAWRSRFGRLA